MRAFSQWMSATAEHVEAALAQCLPKREAHPGHLHEAMRYAMLGGGKRIRPLLVFASGVLSGADARALTAAACALEMIHVYSLVHDDLPCMDNDDLRRGRPTVHRVYDEATALLVGDALQTEAFAVLTDSNAPLTDAQRVRLVAELARASGSRGMAGGQAVDLASVGKALDADALAAMHRMKTGALLCAAVRMGAWCGATLTAREEQGLADFSAAIGLAYQVVDDVLDASADTATLGKTAGKDAADGKPTYVSLLGLDAARHLAEELHCQALAALKVWEGTDAVRNLQALANLIVRRGH